MNPGTKEPLAQTPEANAAAFMSWRWDTCRCNYVPAGEVVPADFARRLERERDHARRMLDRGTPCLLEDGKRKEIGEIIKERDEARAEAARLREALPTISDLHNLVREAGGEYFSKWPAEKDKNGQQLALQDAVLMALTKALAAARGDEKGASK